MNRVGIVKKGICWETSRDTSEPIVFCNKGTARKIELETLKAVNS